MTGHLLASLLAATAVALAASLVIAGLLALTLRVDSERPA